ncbi:Holliday junction branch migration protein RuvA [Candidatus Roizmanbacteria bacterium]|nr:Holliday junction branch migration protein RuvA [Candidatus Roizmanbacteria bacterium]
MIGKLKGTLVESLGQTGLIETSGGVFYEVFLPTPILTGAMPKPLQVYTYLHVREDALILFGFETHKEYDLFKMLLSVSGVGPKTAYTIVASPFSPGIYEAVSKNDVEFFSNIPGLGKKTAMKIILELSQKMKDSFVLEKMFISDGDKTVIEALVALGFTSQEARKVLGELPKEHSVEQKITSAIKLLTKKG